MRGAKLDGKVALITGAARGQGRSHAVRLAEEGADIIAIDICAQIESVPYSMSSPGDLAETERLVTALGRRIHSVVADVRDLSGMQAAVASGEANIGPLDIVVANAGIGSIAAEHPDHGQTFRDTMEVNVFGVWNTISAAAPSMIAREAGGSMILTSSVLGLAGRGGDGSGAFAGYVAAKHGVVGLMRMSANWLAPYSIRVNTVHPTGVDTGMINNEVTEKWVARTPSAEAVLSNLIEIDMLRPSDISNAVLFLASDEAQYITGVALPVDAGFLVK
jgi:SDR family mycofactocin-dependent oxidoreductase